MASVRSYSAGTRSNHVCAVSGECQQGRLLDVAAREMNATGRLPAVVPWLGFLPGAGASSLNVAHVHALLARRSATAMEIVLAQPSPYLSSQIVARSWLT